MDIEMNVQKKYFEDRFTMEKRSIQLKDCKIYIELFYPDKKQWFYDLCTAKKEDGRLEKQWADIKKMFYAEFFPKMEKVKGLSRRERELASWGLKASDTVEGEKE